MQKKRLIFLEIYIRDVMNFKKIDRYILTYRILRGMIKVFEGWTCLAWLYQDLNSLGRRNYKLTVLKLWLL